VALIIGSLPYLTLLAIVFTPQSSLVPPSGLRGGFPASRINRIQAICSTCPKCACMTLPETGSISTPRSGPPSWLRPGASPPATARSARCCTGPAAGPRSFWTRVDLSGGSIAIRSLKKRKDASCRTRVIFRSVPVPGAFLDTLNTAHGIREAQRSRKKAAQVIWDLGRVRGWQIVKGVMIEAGLPDAPHRSPKGLRHGFGVHAVVQGVPLHMLQRWLGHAQLSTTAIYADAVGREEQDIAARMWR